MSMKPDIGWDTAYEWKAVALLSLGFGLVGLDRFMILPMFPSIMQELDLGYGDLGLITGVLSIAWGVSALFMGRVADRVGPRAVIIAAMLAFSVLVGASGLATGLVSLLILRTMMGLADGAYTPPSIIATLEASRPSRHGLNLGIQQMMLPLFGLGLAPIIVTQLLHVVDWRWIFPLVSIPGLIVAFLLYRVLRNPTPERAAEHTLTHDATPHKWTDVFAYRNVPLNMVGMLCWLTCLIVTSALLPNYLTDYLHLDLSQMGSFSPRSASAPALAPSHAVAVRLHRAQAGDADLGTRCDLLPDHAVEHRRGAGQAVLLSVWHAFLQLRANHVDGRPLSAEAVPAKLMATATGLVIGVGEIFGGGFAPIIAGFVAEHYGIQYMLQLAIGGLVIGLIVALALKETAPVRIGAAKPAN